MSERPDPISRTDELLCCLIDQVAGLRTDLTDRVRTSARVTGVKEPAAAKKAAAGKKSRTEVTGK